MEMKKLEADCCHNGATDGLDSFTSRKDSSQTVQLRSDTEILSSFR